MIESESKKRSASMLMGRCGMMVIIMCTSRRYGKLSLFDESSRGAASRDWNKRKGQKKIRGERPEQ